MESPLELSTAIATTCSGAEPPSTVFRATSTPVASASFRPSEVPSPSPPAIWLPRIRLAVDPCATWSTRMPMVFCGGESVFSGAPSTSLSTMVTGLPTTRTP